MRAVYRSLSVLTLVSPMIACQQLSRENDPGRHVDAIRLVTTPSARNFDGKPGADGFLVKLYFLSHDYPKAIPVGTGTLELCLYEGVYPELVPGDTTPLKTWRHEARNLAAFSARSFIGTSYTLAVRWDDGEPVRGDVTLVARYHTGVDRVLTASPVSHTLGVR